MIVYSSTKSEFRQDVRDNRIEESILAVYQRTLGHDGLAIVKFFFYEHIAETPVLLSQIVRTCSLCI